MEARGALVSYKVQNKTFFGSALLINYNTVLTTGAALASYIEYCVDKNFRNVNTVGYLNENIDISIIFEETREDVIDSGNDKNPDEDDSTQTTIFQLKDLNNVYYQKGKIARIFNCDSVDQIIRTSLSDWEINNFKEFKHTLARQYLLSTIIAIETDPGVLVRSLEDLCSIFEPPHRSERVFLETSPFGNISFLNSYSEGIMSNTFGKNAELFLTDASSAPGSEGGAIFVYKNGKRIPIGLVLSSVNFWKNEWCGFTLALSLTCLLPHIKDKSFESLIQEKIQNENNPTEHLEKFVVRIICGSEWGSGIVVNKSLGLIVTASHVINKHRSHKIVGHWNGDLYILDLVYRTVDEKPYDLAILRTSSDSLTEMTAVQFAETTPSQGEQVMAVGYPMFEKNVQTIPTISRGSIARSTPYMLQTTCIIQSGASGGAILRDNGDLLGIIINTTTSDDTHYPHLNMAVPGDVIREPLAKYAQTRDKTVFFCLQRDEPKITELWGLSSKL